jgi:hypothetical protein
MLRIIFASIMVIHGLLHFVGFAKAWATGPKGQLSGESFIEFSGHTSKATGVVWLLAGLLFLSASLGFLLRKKLYWIPAVAALVISQVLIVMDWPDAKYGTILNSAVLIVVIFSAAAIQFGRMVGQEVDSIRFSARGNQIVITEEAISHLPSNVQRWMRRSNVVGRNTRNIIRIVQKGCMRTKVESKWMPFEGVQYFSIDPPAFVWSATIRAAPLFTIAARDKFQDGKGNMLIKPLFMVTAADSRGQEINQGTLLRYMAEMAWFPQAAVSKYVRWEFIDDHRARVTMAYGGTSACGVYRFNDDGTFAGFEALRYGDFDGTYRMEKWSVATTGYRSFNGIVIGNKNEVTWKLKEGDFKWLRLEITKMDWH